MPIKKCKPTSPGRRQMTIADFSGLTRKKPEKSLTKGKKRVSGRDSAGRVSIRRRGGGHKRRYRDIDFHRADKAGVPCVISALEYDPNRSVRIALVQYRDGEKRYILAPEQLAVGDTVICADRTKVRTGNRMQMQNIPVGYKIYNIESQSGKGGQMVRSAGTSATLMGFDGMYAIVQLPSGEVPKVRGKSMNAVDHPHGGGEGHSPIGLKKGPRTPWGKPALGVKTRHRKKQSTKLIVRRRIRKRKKK